ncbi:hypothetical protein AAE478_008990 [Parahypoxylon ruwenzoriense]
MDHVQENHITFWRRELDNRFGGNEFMLQDFVLAGFPTEATPGYQPGSQVDDLSDGTLRSPEPGKGEIQLATLNHLYGWRLWVNMACLFFGLLLSSLETTIMATSLVSISSELRSFDKSNWAITAYLLTYTCFLIIFARVSDLFGRKGTFLLSLVFFTTFSLACGLSRNMEQLIVFRAFQGIGGSGLYSMAVSVITEITPLKYVGVSSGLMGAIFAMSSLLGPNLGGAITSHSTWRWVFYLNLFFPRNAKPLLITRRTFASLDYLGMLLCLVASMMVIFALEQGGLFYPWNSAVIVASFVISAIGFVGFVVWEWLISINHRWAPKSTLPLFPVHLGKQRIVGFSFLTAFLAGFPFLVTVVFLPQRFQLVNGLSPVDAGVRMLPLLLLSASGAGLGGIISKKHNISWYVLTSSLGLQLIGLGLMTTLPTNSNEIPVKQYGFQAILGLGFGLTLSCLVIVAQTEVKDDYDVGITISAITQIRVLGGVIGVAVSQAILNEQLSVSLSSKLPAEKLAALLRSAVAISTFTPEEINTTIQCYGSGFNLQYKVMMGFSAASFITNCGCWQRNPKNFSERDNAVIFQPTPSSNFTAFQNPPEEAEESIPVHEIATVTIYQPVLWSTIRNETC